MAVDVRAELAALLGEGPVPAVVVAAEAVAPVVCPAVQPAPGPWRVTASASGGRVQISNNVESRLVRKAEVETYLRRSRPGALAALLR